MSNHAKHRHTFGIRSLAALLAFYAMGGVLLTMLMIGGRYEHLDRTLLAAAGFAFTVTAGSSALTVWRLERSAPWWLIACGVAGAAMCLLMPAAAPSVATGKTWMAAALGAAFFFVFLLVAAEYVRRRMRG